ncbi:MAG TPA: hypothetical protein VGI29_06600 [Candidatus Binataceae bacterium]
MKRTKMVIVVGCLLGLALAWLPAYASPTDKKITLTCNSPNAGDSISGSVTVTLCDTTDCGTSLVCTPVNCDSSGTMSVTQACGTNFKVGAVSVNICYQEDQDGGPTCTQHPGTGGGIAITGKGFTTVVGPGSPPTGDGDTVSLIVK